MKKIIVFLLCLTVSANFLFAQDIERNVKEQMCIRDRTDILYMLFHLSASYHHAEYRINSRDNQEEQFYCFEAEDRKSVV